MAIFGSGQFGTARFGPDVIVPVATLVDAVPHGRASYVLRPRCYQANKNNVLGTDISRALQDGSVKVDASQDTPMTFTATVTDLSQFPAFSYIAPFLTIEWWDQDGGLKAVTEQMGLYLVMPPQETHTAAQASGQIDGQDPTWALKRNTITSSLVFNSGVNIVKSIKSVITGAGFTRQNIPAKGNTFGKQHAFDPGTPRLDIINELLMLIGYYPLWADRQGILTSRRIRSLGREEPAHKISSALGDVVNTVTLDPDWDRLCNRVTVTKTDANNDPVFITKTNNRRDSPISTVNMDGIVFGKKIEGSNIDTIEEAKDLANKTLEEGASFFQRISVETLPYLQFDVRDVVHLVIFSDAGDEIATGRWWADQLEIGMSPRQGAMKWRLNHLVHWDPDDGA